MIEKELDPFLDKVYDSERPVLLALSGGVDSLALFYSLLRYGQKKDFMFAAAHVDHRWRKESTEEAKVLEKLCEDNFVPFHLKTLDPETLQGNLEEACREARLDFFGNLSLEHDYQAVILGHHADDMAEGVIKRLFEGGSLSNLSAMKKESLFEGLPLWRPLLKVPKRKLQEYVNSLSVSFVDDATNRDERFLRGRLRSKLFPYLAELFGKEIAKPLAEAAEESQELMEYFERKLKEEFESVEWIEEGAQFKPVTEELCELKWLIKKIGAKMGLSISKGIVQEMAETLLSNGRKQFGCGGFQFFVAKGVLNMSVVK